MNTTERMLVTLAISIACMSAIRADDPILCDIETIPYLDSFPEKVRELCEKTISGHKVAVEIRVWEPHEYNDSKYYVYKKSCVYGHSAWIGRAITPLKGGSQSETGTVRNADCIYTFEKTSDKYKLLNHVVAWVDKKRYRDDFYMNHAVLPHIYHPQQDFVHKKSIDEMYDGVSAIRLDVETRSKIQHTIYIDKQTYQFLNSETEARIPGIGKPGDRMIAKTTYQTVGGRRVPLKYENYAVSPDGKRKQNWTEYLFTEYVPYTPTPDELDMEKQFGVKPLPLPPKPADFGRPKSAGGGRAVWLYAAGGLLLIAAVFGAYRLRRQAARLAASA